MPQVPIPQMGRQVVGPTQGVSAPRGPQGNMFALQQSQQLAQGLAEVGDRMVRIGARLRSDRDYADAKERHLEISDYVIQQQNEYGKLTPREQLGAAKGYHAKVNSFIQQKMKELGSDQARGMMSGPAKQSLLGFKEWSLTQELKAQKAHEFGLSVAAGENLTALAAAAIIQPEGDAQAVIGADQSQDPNSAGLDTGPSVASMRRDNAAALVAAGQNPNRTRYDQLRDSAFSNFEEQADRVATSPEERQSYVRGKKTEFYQSIIQTMLAEDPPRHKRAKEMLDSVPATDMLPKAKAELLKQIRTISNAEKAKADSDRALSVTLKALDDAGTPTYQIEPDQGGLEFSVGVPTAAERAAAAAQDLERQFRAHTEGKPGISASVYSAARQHLRVEAADLAERENREGVELLSEIMDAAPNATSMEDLPPDLAARAQANAVTMQGLTSRAKVRQGSNLSRALGGADAGFFAVNQQRIKDAQQLLIDSVTVKAHEALNQKYLAARLDPRKLTGLVGKDENGEDKSVDEGSQIILAEFYPLGDKQAMEMVNAYRALSVGAAPTDPGFGSLGSLAAKQVFGPSMESKLFGKLTLDIKTGKYLPSAELDPVMEQFALDRLKEAHAKGELPSKPTLTDMIKLLQTDQRTSRFMLDRADPASDIPIPVYALKAYQKGVEDGRLVVNIGGGRMVDVSQFGEGFILAVQASAPKALEKVMSRGYSKAAATYLLVQDELDKRNSIADEENIYSGRTFKTASDWQQLVDDAKMSGRMVTAAESYVSPVDVDPLVSLALGAAKEDIEAGRGLTAAGIDQAKAYIDREAKTPEEAVKLKKQVEDLAASLGYQTALSPGLEPEARAYRAARELGAVDPKRRAAALQTYQSAAAQIYARTLAIQEEITKQAALRGKIFEDIEKQFGPGKIEGMDPKRPNLGALDPVAARAAKAEAMAEAQRRDARALADITKNTELLPLLEKELRAIHDMLYGSRQQLYTGATPVAYKTWLKSLEGGK